MTLDKIETICNLLNLPSASVIGEFIQFKSKMVLQSSSKSIELLKKFDYLRLLYAKILSIFPDSYLCESAFSALNFIVNEYRASLTDQNASNCLKIALNDSLFDFYDIIDTMNCQISH